MKKKAYTGILENLNTQEIYLNVNYLQKGDYSLKIIHNNKIIKNTHFTKHK